MKRMYFEWITVWEDFPNLTFFLIKHYLLLQKSVNGSFQVTWTSSLSNLPSCTVCQFEMSGKEQLAIQAENSTSCNCHKYSNACSNPKTSMTPKYEQLWLRAKSPANSIYLGRRKRNHSSCPDHSMPEEQCSLRPAKYLCKSF